VPNNNRSSRISYGQQQQQQQHAAGDLCGGVTLAQSFNHNLLMSPIGPARMQSVAAALAARQQQQQQQQAVAPSGRPLPAGNLVRAAALVGTVKQPVTFDLCRSVFNHCIALHVHSHIQINFFLLASAAATVPITLFASTAVYLLAGLMGVWKPLTV